MKKLILLSSLLLAGAFAHASGKIYSCKADEQTYATLTVYTHVVDWQEGHEASSRGVYAGVETAPFSEWRDYNLFKLINFYSTEDSAYMMAVEPAAFNAAKLKVYVYFDNDDHYEDIESYECTAK